MQRSSGDDYLEAYMQKPAEQFAHVMLFECPDCTLAISLALTRDKRNFEDIDGHLYTLRCSCGWSGSLLGALARRHWVESWEPRTNIFSETRTVYDGVENYRSDDV
jgi:hypothetical protein